MDRPRTSPLGALAALLLAVAGLLLLPGTALAADAGSVAAALRRDPVYVDAKATASVDRSRLEQAVRAAGGPVYVAVLPQAAADNSGGQAAVTAAIGEQLSPSAVLFTVTGSTVYGDEGPGSGLGQGQAASIAAANAGGDLTDGLVASIGQAASVARGSGGGSGSAAPSDGSSSTGHGGALALGVLALLGVGGGGFLYARSRRRREQVMEGSRADVESLYDRLGADVSNLAPGDDPVARQALADAAERYSATGALLARSDTPGE